MGWWRVYQWVMVVDGWEMGDVMWEIAIVNGYGGWEWWIVNGVMYMTM